MAAGSEVTCIAFGAAAAETSVGLDTAELPVTAAVAAGHDQYKAWASLLKTDCGLY